ncbi:hypothetical protein EPI10_020531 [Gossypium australe]|uniref:Uncharacterized protein n=1 Tax=Gossypium australe TaxID=47621 RepID=A0A5B6WE36_9ROSI|nr:hypothetical protein EPI10_020531 [Gossypium australe]
MGSGSNPRHNPANPVVSNLDDIAEMKKARMELPKQLEDRCKWLEEKFKALESADYHSGIDAKELSLVPDLNMEKKPKESFRQYAQRWKEVATTVTTGHQGPPRQESNTRKNTEKLQFTPIPMTYRELYQNLFDAHVVSPFYLKPMQPPYPKWYDASARCKYHTGITGHSIENCTAFKKLVERLIKMGIVKFDDPSSAENPLLNHADKGVNLIVENAGRKIKVNIAEVRTSLKEVWKKMVERGLIIQDSRNRSREARNYYEFHDEEDHEIQKCSEFRALVQSLMDNKELEFFEYTKEEKVCSSEGGSTEKVYRANRPVVIIIRLRINEAGNYDCNVTIPGEENLINSSEEGLDMGFYMRSGRRYDTLNTKAKLVKGKSLAFEQRKDKPELPVNEPINEKEVKEFLKFLKHSEYNVVEQLHKQPARISVLALLLSSETHRNELMKVLNETYVLIIFLYTS